MDYKEIFDNILEYSKRYTVIIGYIDIINYKFISYRCKSVYQDTESPWGWSTLARNINPNTDIMVISGNASIESITDSLLDFDFLTVNKEGHYEIKALLKYIPAEYDSEGHCTCRGFEEIEYMETQLIDTFEARERDEKLNVILSEGMDNLFNL